MNFGTHFLAYTCIVFFTIGGLLYLIFTITKYFSNELIKEKIKNILIFILSILGILLLTYSFLAPYRVDDILPNVGQDIKGQLGDQYGGLMNPFIAMSGVIITGLAFWVQYEANQEQRKQFKISIENQEKDKLEQKFENQFFELLKLHKENVAEMFVYISAEYQYRGRKVFELAVESIHFLISKTIYSQCQDSTNIKQCDNLSEKEIFKYKFDYCYKVFFWDKNVNSKYNLGNDVNISFIFPPQIEKKHQNWHFNFGHYYRHLFMLIKYVIESDIIINYDDKMKYLKIIRAQLSNYEQIMLFYNWLVVGYGDVWEEESINGNKFFTKYKMIHNLWIRQLYQNQFIVDKVNSLIEIYNLAPKETPLFEFQNEDFNYYWNL